MKRKVIAISMASMLMCSLATSCGGGVQYEPEEDATKSYLYVDSYSGGFGSEFFSVAARAFEKANANKPYADGKMGVKIEVGEATMNNSTNFKNGVANASSDVHVVEGLYYTDLLKDKTIMDVTDIVTANLSDGKTIESKLNTEQKNVLKYEGKYYTIPTFAGFSGLTYNADLWAENNLYFADSLESPEDVSSYTGKAYTGRPFVRNKNTKKSPGPDGQYDTDDDGLPSSYEEFFYLYDTMLNCSPSITPMVLYGGHYSNYIFQELLCAATSADGMNAMFSFDSNGEEVEIIDKINNDGTYTTKKVVITESNGYEATMQASKYMATKFIKHLSTNTVNGKYYIDSRSRGQSLSNTGAQKLFMESYLDPNQTSIATLVEGVYWYNESAGTREGLANSYGEEVENMNLKYMPLPAQEYGTVVVNEGTTQLVADSFQYYLVINAKVANDPEKLALAKDFVKFMYSDAMLQEMTVASGIPFALNYDLTDTQYNSMNTLSQSFWNVYKGAKDSDSYITGLSLSSAFLANTAKFSFKSTNNAFKAMVNGAETEDALAYFYNNRNTSAKDFFEGMMIAEKDWGKYSK